MKASLIRLSLLFVCVIGGAAVGHSVFPYIKAAVLPDFYSRFPAEGVPSVSLLFGTIETYDPNSRFALVSLDNPYDRSGAPLMLRVHIGQGAQIQLRSDTRAGTVLATGSLELIADDNLGLPRRAMLSLRRVPGSLEVMSVMLEGESGS